MGGHKFFVAEIGGHSFIDADFWKIWDPLPKKMINPNTFLKNNISKEKELKNDYVNYMNFNCSIFAGAPLLAAELHRNLRKGKEMKGKWEEKESKGKERK